MTAGKTLRGGVVARDGLAIIHAECGAAADDIGFAKVNQRCVDGEALGVLRPCGGR